MRALIACGGTGGHFYPGYALAKELRRQGWETLFILRTGDPAAKVLAQSGFASAEIEIRSLPRNLNPVEHFSFLWKLPAAMLTARRIVKDWQPDVVAGTGGYAAFPAVFSAWLCGVPSIVHESNAKLGLSNLAVTKFADILACGLPLAKTPSIKTAATGTPIREEFSHEISKTDARVQLGLSADKITVLIFGGSQGARALNLAAAKAVIKLGSRPGFQALHITGRRDYEEIKKLYGSEPVCLLDYCDKMHLAMRACDFAVCRSGASTVAELAALKIPAVLVPLPSAAADHQTANALALGKAAQLVPQLPQDFLGRLEAAILRLADGGAALESMRRAYGGLSIPDPFAAASALAKETIALAARKS